MKSKNYISIDQLKRQPKLGQTPDPKKSKSFNEMLTELKDISSSKGITDLSNNIEIFQQSLTPAKLALADMTTMLSSTVTEFEQLSAGVGRAQAYFKDFKDQTNITIKNLSFLIETQKDLQKSFKMSSAGGFDFVKQLRGITVTVDKVKKALEIGDAKLFKYAEGLGKITGGFITSKNATDGMVDSLIKSQAFLQNNLGVSEEAAQNFELFTRSMGKNAVASIENITTVAETFSKATGQDQTQLMAQMVEDISKMGADVATQFGRVPGQLEAATMKARLLGTSMEQLSGVGEKLLDIESSIGTEMELQAISGQRLVTDQGKSLTNEFRMAQVQGNAVKQTELMQQFLEKHGDQLKTNMFFRKKASELFGIDSAKLLEMNAAFKVQRDLGVESLVAKAEGNLKTLEVKLRADSTKTADEIDAILASAKQANIDRRTPAERSADALERIDSNIALRGMGTGDGATFVNEINKAIQVPIKFAEKAAATFESEKFIKGIGGLGILSDRLNLAVTPIQQLGESIPILGENILELSKSITGLTSFVKQPTAEVVPRATATPAAAGGYISGPGTSTSDSIPARLSDGEYVINAAATRRYRPLLDKINSGPVKLAAGGMVSNNGKMEALLSSILTTLRGNNVLGETSMNGRKRV